MSAKQLPTRYLVKINTKIARRFIIGGSLLIVLGFVVFFASLLNLYSQANCTNPNGCSATSQQLANIQFAGLVGHIGMGLAYAGFTVAVVCAGLLLIAQYRDKRR